MDILLVVGFCMSLHGTQELNRSNIRLQVVRFPYIRETLPIDQSITFIQTPITFSNSIDTTP